MQANKGKIDPQKHRCDRCQKTVTVVNECSFTWKHPFKYWKAIYESQTGKRLTRKRQAELGAQWEFDWKEPPAHWMDLCEGCWSEISKPFNGFPMQWWEKVVLSGRAGVTSAKKCVPTKSQMNVPR